MDLAPAFSLPVFLLLLLLLLLLLQEEEIEQNAVRKKGQGAKLLIGLALCGYGREVSVISEEQDLELERQLKIINKPALQTIQTEYGDILNCVDIHKQPAFDHPLLKNHKLQRRPSSALPVTKTEAPSFTTPVNVSMRNGCPSGTVPIRRTTKASLIQAKLSKPANINDPPSHRSGSHFSYYNIYKNSQLFYGARAYINAYNPKVEDGQSSTAQIWIQAGPPEQVNSIEVGWIVDPGLYGDTRTRLFTYWTGDGYKTTGCYNILCPGFVQIAKDVDLGQALSRTSIVEGQQFVMRVYVYQDQKTANWWFVFTDHNIHVGYWPRELFPYLDGGASVVSFGGRTQGIVNQLSPPMGSGLKPDNSHRKYFRYCFFAQVQVQNSQNVLEDPFYAKAFNDKSGCYGLFNPDEVLGNVGYSLFFGGPGGPCGN